MTVTDEQIRAPTSSAALNAMHRLLARNHTVKGSGNGRTAAMDGVNRWRTSADVTPRSWIVLSDEAHGHERLLMLDHDLPLWFSTELPRVFGHSRAHVYLDTALIQHNALLIILRCSDRNNLSDLLAWCERRIIAEDDLGPFHKDTVVAMGKSCNRAIQEAEQAQ